MAETSATGPTRGGREYLSATIDLESLDTIARPHEGTAYVLLELRESLLADVVLWLGDVRLEFSVVDPALGTVEPRDGTVEPRGRTVEPRGETLAADAWPLPLVRAVLDRVGVGLLERSRPERERR